MLTPNPALLQTLRARLEAVQPRVVHGVWPFGDRRVDACLSGGGLALGALHEIAAEGIEAETGAVGAGFLACLLAGMKPDGMQRAGPIFWIGPAADLHPAGLLGYGLDPGRIVQVLTRDDAGSLAAMETVLRGGAAAAVVAEIGRIGRIAGRRLQLACLRHGVTGFVLRRWPHGQKAAEEATAAVTRWRIAAAPSAQPLSAQPASAQQGEARPRWRVELVHARGGMEGAWIMETGGRDATHSLRVVAELADAAVAPPGRRAAGRGAAGRGVTE